MDSPAQRFLFQRRNEKIDWRKLASIDVEKIAREIDVDAIQENILSVTYCNIEHELGYNELDPNFIKLYRLAQLTVEYLLHCQEYLQQSLEEKDLNAKQLDEQISSLAAGQEHLKDELKSRNTSYKNLKKEFQKSRKMIGEYQLMIRAGANGLHKCTSCEKSFVTESYLRSHLERRHPEEFKKLYASRYSPVNQSFRDIELQNELNEIKTRLRMTEEDLKCEREGFSSTKLKENQKSEEALENLRQQNETWRFNEQNKMKDEIENYKNLMMSELKQTQKEKEVLQQNVLDLQKTAGKKKSNLGDLVDDDSNMAYQDLFAKMQGMESGLKEKINALQEQHKKEETAHKIVYNKKISQEKEKHERLEQERLKDKKFYEQQIAALQKKLTEHDTLIEENKASLALDRTDGRPSSRESIIKPSDETLVQKELPEKDSITLYVAVNQTLSQRSSRVFKSAASAKGDWIDLFTFNALLQPVGDFQKPIYVYSCPGSPYWRQYVSSSSFPPKQNYKHDMTLYVTPTKLMGTVKLSVFDAGSGSVVRSMISKDDHVPEWRQKGLTFYALKTGPSKTSLARSGTFNSSIFDGVSDEEDVSVSSFTGTEVARQDLADDIKRSRENLVEDEDEEEKETGADKGANATQGEMNADELESDKDDDESEDDNDNGEENEKVDGGKGNNELQQTKESHFGTSSSSFLNTSIPPKGEFYPYEGNPLAVARYDHSKDMLGGQRKEIQDILDDHMEKRGVDPDETRMSAQVFKNKMKHHKKEREMKDKSFPGFTHYRQKLNTALDDFSAREWAKKKGKKAGKKLKAAAGAVKGAVKFRRSPKHESNNWRPTDDKPRDRPKPYTKDLDEVSSTSNEQVLSTYQRHIQNEDDDDDDDEDDEDYDDDEDIAEGEEGNDELSETWDTEGGEEDEDDEEEEEEEEEEESDEEGGEERRYQHYQTEEPYRPKMRSPQGAKVKELAKNLEASLTSRGKKPAGAVDLHNTLEKEEEGEEGEQRKERKKPKRSVSFREQNQYHEDGNFDDDEDEESDFTLTSFEGSKNSTNPGGNQTIEDMDELLGSYRPVSKNTSGKNPSSSTPYSASTRHSSDTTGQKQQQQTAITKFTLEDFDDDESF